MDHQRHGNTEEQKLVPRQEGTLTQDQILADARRMKTILKEPELILRFGGGRNAQPHSQSDTTTFVLELSLQCPAAAEAMAFLRKWYACSALLLLSLPPGAVAADQGDSGGGRLVNGVVPSPVCIPASLASLVLHNPDNLCCYLNAAVFLLADVSALRQPTGPLQGATPLEHSRLRSTPVMVSCCRLSLHGAVVIAPATGLYGANPAPTYRKLLTPPAVPLGSEATSWLRGGWSADDSRPHQ